MDPNLVRVWVGLEDPAELMLRFEHALEQVERCVQERLADM